MSAVLAYSHELLSSALEYAKLGWRVFPIYEPRQTGINPICTCLQGEQCSHVGKHPRVAHWQDVATTDAKQIIEWWTQWPNANIGIATGMRSGEHGLLVLDADGTLGAETVQDAMSRHPRPLTPAARTGRLDGGTHYYFRHPMEYEIRSEQAANWDVRGCDLRADGGYVVAPPSLHRSGEYYTWDVRPASFAMADTPNWLSPHLRRRITRPVDGGEEQDDDFGEMTLDQRIDYARRMMDRYVERARQHGGRNDIGTAYSQQLRDCGIPYGHAESLMREYHAQVFDAGDHEYRLEEAIASLQGAYRTERREPPWKHMLPAEVHLTDVGNSLRLLKLCGDDVRFVPPWNSWLIWTGTHWERDDSQEEMVQRAKQVAEQMHIEAAKPETKNAANLKKWAWSTEARSKIDNMIALASSEPAIRAQPTDFDRNEHLLNFQNGTVDLLTGKLYPHTRYDMLTRMIPIRYDGEARLREWEETLRRILPSPAVREFFQLAWGYSVIGTPKDYIFLVEGETKTGKTTLMRTLVTALGPYAKTRSMDTFARADKVTPGAPRADLVGLQAVRAVWSDETDQARRLSEGLIKQISGGDFITARGLYERRETSYKAVFALWLSFNHRLYLDPNDDAVWKRARVFSFDQQIPDDEIVTTMRDTLSNLEYAGPAIAAWIVKGAQMYKQQGHLRPPEEVITATQTYRDSMDYISEAIEDAFVYDESSVITSAELYRIVSEWAVKHGHKKPSSSHFSRVFSRHAARRGYAKVQYKHTSAYRGIRYVGEMSFSEHRIDLDPAQNN